MHTNSRAQNLELGYFDVVMNTQSHTEHIYKNINIHNHTKEHTRTMAICIEDKD